MNLNYQNIAISGGVATGKGTLKNNLREYLEPLGWKFASGGELNRKQSNEELSPSADRVTDEFNNTIEKLTEELFKNEKQYVIEAWLAGWVAREMGDTLRVLLVCSHPAVRIDRVVNRDKVAMEKAKSVIHEREESNMKVWQRLYGNHDFHDPSLFHIVIDTYSTGPMETVGKVLDALGYRKA